MSASEYDIALDPNNLSDSRAIAVHLVGSNKSVLEFGCATGRVTEALTNQGCSVVGIEFDPAAAEKAQEHAENVLVVDLDVDDFEAKLAGQLWDVAVFGDVLEHLRDPLRVLRVARRLLHPHGTIVVSVPNIAHVDVRLALLRGNFDYRSHGLLDRTHLRFFTLPSLESLLLDAGFVLVDIERTSVPAFATELDLQRDDFAPPLVEEILQDAESETYQYIVRAVLDNGDAAVQELSANYVRLEAALRETRVELSQVRAHADNAEQRVKAVEETAENADRRAHTAEERARTAEQSALAAEAELQSIRQTKLWRYAAGPRRLYSRVRRLPSGQ